jgi:hypothetical protein
MLELRDEFGEKLTPDEYLEHCLESKGGDKERVRTCMK